MGKEISDDFEISGTLTGTHTATKIMKKISCEAMMARDLQIYVKCLHIMGWVCHKKRFKSEAI